MAKLLYSNNMAVVLMVYMWTIYCTYGIGQSMYSWKMHSWKIQTENLPLHVLFEVGYHNLPYSNAIQNMHIAVMESTFLCETVFNMKTL